MSQTLRKPEIIRLARREGRVTVDGLVAHFGVTPQTIRRDLSELAEQGKLERMHGGAVLPSGTTNIIYDERRALMHDVKADIARACARHIPNDCSLFLNIGTTTEAIAAELLGHTGLLVVTNNINIATTLADNPDIDVIVTGGTLRRSDGGLIGYLATKTIEQFRFDFGIIGCSALNTQGDILDFDLQEVEVSHAIIRQCDTICLAADSSKFRRSAPARIGSISDVDLFFTDGPCDPGFEAVCNQGETRIIHA
jgi:DeoR family transcriptional regulator, glycerol-3-phosphate regulon repressor